MTEAPGDPSPEPVDPDVAAFPTPLGLLVSPAADVRTLAAIAGGGVIGSVCRYEVGLWWPTDAQSFPWTTLAINLVGSALLSVLIVLVTDVWTGRLLLRPLLGTGVIGGFTTYSTFSVDTERLLSGGRTGLALAYVLSTLAVCGAASWGAAMLTRAAVWRRGPR
jgi:CrcB protein